MSDLPFITSAEREIVDQILSSLLMGVEVHAFGSRVTGENLKQFSDLDLWVKSSEPLAVSTLRQVVDAFDDSNLPFRVDVLDGATLDESFILQLERHSVKLTAGACQK